MVDVDWYTGCTPIIGKLNVAADVLEALAKHMGEVFRQILHHLDCLDGDLYMMPKFTGEYAGRDNRTIWCMKKECESIRKIIDKEERIPKKRIVKRKVK